MNQAAYDLASELEEAVQQHKGVTSFVWYAVADCQGINQESLEAMMGSIAKEAARIDDLLSQYFHAQEADTNTQTNESP